MPTVHHMKCTDSTTPLQGLRNEGMATYKGKEQEWSNITFIKVIRYITLGTHMKMQSSKKNILWIQVDLHLGLASSFKVFSEC